MNIKILGSESLGVRGLSCTVELKNRKIVIDPGIALGWSRFGFFPHPFQIAIGQAVRNKIIGELKNAHDVIISHFDGDHCPLSHPNPYQLGLAEVRNSLSDCRIWVPGSDNCSLTQQNRRGELARIVNRELLNCEGIKEGPLEFSFPVPHGARMGKKNMLVMSRIQGEGKVFVQASDIQLLHRSTVEKILDWEPDVVLASGPPLYHYSHASSQTHRENAWKIALELSRHVDTLIIDHHLLRCQEGIEWLERLNRASENRVCCAGDFMNRNPLFLEAWRKELYEWLPVSENWHEHYERGRVDVNDYRIKGWEALITNGKIKPCKWYDACPIKQYTETGKLERYWVEDYCLVKNKNCVRYHMEEKGVTHPDNLLPNGEIRQDLH
jgi:predicted metallo-beta-lactamase superfamily hydrolase